MQTENLRVTGMSCGGCTAKVTRALKAVAGVRDVQVSLGTGEVTVQYDERVVTLGQLKSAVESAGYRVAKVNAAQATQSDGSCSGRKTPVDLVETGIAANQGAISPRLPERATRIQ